MDGQEAAADIFTCKQWTLPTSETGFGFLVKFWVYTRFSQLKTRYPARAAAPWGRGLNPGTKMFQMAQILFQP